VPPQTWVARFVVDHGRVTEEGGLLRTFKRRRLDEPDVDLHVLAEPRGVKGDDLGAQAIENIGKLFLEDRLSLTGGLLRAVRSTHQTLAEWNRRSIPREQVTLGFVAAAVQGAVVYLTHAGPGVTFHGRDGRLDPLPLEDEALSPLGEEAVEPALRRFELQPGDVILAASEALLSVADQAMLESLLSRGTEEALPELYLLTRDLPSFALIAITCFEGTEEEAEAAKDEASTSFEGILSAPRSVDAQPVTREAPELFLEELPEPPKPDPVVVTPPPVDISRPVVRLRGEQPVARGAYARTTGGARRFNLDLSQPRLLTMVATAAILLFLGAFVVPDLIRENRGEKIARLLQDSQLQLGSGLAETDPTLKRQMLTEASALAAEALRLNPENQPAADLRQQAAAALQQIDAVFDLGPMTTVATFSRQVTGEVSLDSMVLAGGSAYILDSGGGRILSVALAADGPPATIFEDGATYRGTPAKKPLFLAWEGDADGRLLVLDAERKLFAIRPGSVPEPLPLRRTNTWTSVAGVAAYDGNFYVLDPDANQVHRYLPALTGFDSEPGAGLNGQNDLKDAVAMAVDGDIFVVKRTGDVLRYEMGNAADFGLGGIDRPLDAPNAISVAPVGAEVYLADAGNKRVVVAGKDGVFRRQYVSSALTDIRAIGVDEIAGQIYVVVGDALLTAPLVR
jgi:hypothetical protein